MRRNVGGCTEFCIEGVNKGGVRSSSIRSGAVCIDDAAFDCEAVSHGQGDVNEGNAVTDVGEVPNVVQNPWSDDKSQATVLGLCLLHQDQLVAGVEELLGVGNYFSLLDAQDVDIVVFAISAKGLSLG